MWIGLLLFYIILIFIAILIYFSLNEPKILRKSDVITISILGIFIYGTLFGLFVYYEYDYMAYSSGKFNKIHTSNINLNKSLSHSNKNKNIVADDKDKRGKIIGDTDSKIYHVPGSTYYEKELEKQSNNEYFDTVEEAKKSGYRAPKR